MGYIQKSQKNNVVDMSAYKGRKPRAKIDAAHNPSKRVTLTDRLGNGYTEVLNKLGLGPEYRGPKELSDSPPVTDDASPYGMPRPTGAGKTSVFFE